MLIQPGSVDGVSPHRTTAKWFHNQTPGPSCVKPSCSNCDPSVGVAPPGDTYLLKQDNSISMTSLSLLASKPLQIFSDNDSPEAAKILRDASNLPDDIPAAFTSVERSDQVRQITKHSDSVFGLSLIHI